MTDKLREQLHSGDPLSHEPALSTMEAEGMRRAILSAARAAAHGKSHVRPRLVLAIAILCAVATGVFIGVRSRSGDDRIAKPQTVERQQLQFDTPGGTKIIWVLNPAFEL